MNLDPQYLASDLELDYMILALYIVLILLQHQIYCVGLGSVKHNPDESSIGLNVVIDLKIIQPDQKLTSSIYTSGYYMYELSDA